MSEQCNSLTIKFDNNKNANHSIESFKPFCKKWNLTISGLNPIEFDIDIDGDNFFEFYNDLEHQLKVIAKNFIDSGFLCLYSESWLNEGMNYSYIFFKGKNEENIICKDYEFSVDFYEIEYDFDKCILYLYFDDETDENDDKDCIKTVIHLFEPYLVNREDCEKFIVKRTNWTEAEVRKMSSDEIDEWVSEADVATFLERYPSENISEDEVEKYWSGRNDDSNEEDIEIITFQVSGTMYRDLNAVRNAAYYDAKVYLIPEPTNPYDSNAIRVESECGIHLGYVPSNMLLDFENPHDYDCKISSVVEGNKAPYITVEARKKY